MMQLAAADVLGPLSVTSLGAASFGISIESITISRFVKPLDYMRVRCAFLQHVMSIYADLWLHRADSRRASAERFTNFTRSAMRTNRARGIDIETALNAAPLRRTVAVFTPQHGTWRVVVRPTSANVCTFSLLHNRLWESS